MIKKTDLSPSGYIRLPRTGERCPVTQLCRTTLYLLTIPCSANGWKPAVPAKRRKSNGAVRGVPLIPKEELLNYLGFTGDTELLRLPPAKSRCSFSKLARTTLYELCVPCVTNGRKPPVEAKHYQRQGTTRGIWLINKASLQAYLQETKAIQPRIHLLAGKEPGQEL